LKSNVKYFFLLIYYYFSNSFDPNAPNIYSGTFSVTDAVPSDTFLLPSTVSNGYWQKGVAYVNEHNLGRYWPVMGPQVTLYTPGPWLKPSTTNSLTMVELRSSPCGNEQMCSIELVDYPILDKPTLLDAPILYKRRSQYN
jgi:beta-galactosidase